MTHRISHSLTLAGKLLLTGAGIAAAILHPPAGRAQPKPDALTFEVASVKPSDPSIGGRRGGGPTPGGGMSITGMPLSWIIMMAFDMQPFQVSGGPSWIESQAYDIVAKATTSVTGDTRQPTAEERRQARLRLQSLLADRFQLVVRHESKEWPVFHLVVAKNGPRLKQSAVANGVRQSARGELNGMGATTEILAAVLARQVGRPVLDKTNLTERYDFTLKFAPEMSGGGLEKPGAEPAEASDVAAPSIFTALQEQLGLKLESQKGPVPTIVIESVKKPAAN